MITGDKSMVGSIACGECESVDALHCGTDDNVEELGEARAGDLGDEPMLHALGGDVRLGSRHHRVAGRLGYRSRSGLALTVPSWPIGAGV